MSFSGKNRSLNFKMAATLKIFSSGKHCQYTLYAKLEVLKPSQGLLRATTPRYSNWIHPHPKNVIFVYNNQKLYG